MQSCPSFATGSICAHVVAVSQKTGMMQPYLKWLVKSRRKTGKNFSEAVLQNIPAGRGRKGEKPLRKKERSQERPKIVVTRAGSAKNIDQAAQRIELSLHPSGTQNMLELANSLFTDSGQTIQHQTERSQLTSTSCFGNLLPPGPNATPFFPKPQRGQILIYLLPFCPKQTCVLGDVETPFPTCWGNGLTKGCCAMKLVICTSTAISNVWEKDNHTQTYGHLWLHLKYDTFFCQHTEITLRRALVSWCEDVNYFSVRM